MLKNVIINPVAVLCEKNKIKHSALCCIYCGKSYKTKLNLDKHLILCEITHKSKRSSSDSNLDDDDNDLLLQTISSKKLYEIVMHLALKCNRLEHKVADLSKHVSKQHKKLDIIDHLNNNGYKVVMITSEKLGDAWHDSKLGGTLRNVIDKTGGEIALVDRMIDIKHASAFIGLGSGLSWLSWAIGTPTVLISGFSYPLSEFADCERIFNPDVCNGCFNRHWLNPGDWEWCPDHKDTPRHFECSKTIKTQTVIDAVDRLLSKKEEVIQEVTEEVSEKKEKKSFFGKFF
jgi:hypothetical protein